MDRDDLIAQYKSDLQEVVRNPSKMKDVEFQLKVLTESLYVSFYDYDLATSKLNIDIEIKYEDQALIISILPLDTYTNKWMETNRLNLDIKGA